MEVNTLSNSEMDGVRNRHIERDTLTSRKNVQCTYNRNIEAASRNDGFRGNVICKSYIF